MADVSQLLKRVIELIEQDVAQIGTIAATEGKLPHLVAQDLVKYSGALLNLSAELKYEEDEEKKALSKMSLEELEAKAKELLGK